MQKTISPALQLVHPCLQLSIPFLKRLDPFPETLLSRLARLDEPVLAVKVLGEVVEGCNGRGEGGMGSEE